jgi:beta-lactamase class A
MMTLSDNTATDICFSIAGQDRIRKYLDSWNISPMSIVCDCKALLADYVGVTRDELVHAELTDKQMFLNRGPSPATVAFSDDLQRTNLATPRSMVDLLAGLASGSFLSRSAVQHMFRIMGLEWYRHRIPPCLPHGVRWATKSGSLGGVVNDVGVLFTPRGPVAFAMLATGLSDTVRWERVIARTAQAVCDALGR